MNKVETRLNQIRERELDARQQLVVPGGVRVASAGDYVQRYRDDVAFLLQLIDGEQRDVQQRLDRIERRLDLVEV